MSLNTVEKTERDRAIRAWMPVGLAFLLWFLWLMFWGGFWVPTAILIVVALTFGVNAINATVRWHKVWKLQR